MKQFLILLCLSLGMILPTVRGADATRDQLAVDKAVERGVAFLITQQQKDGSIVAAGGGHQHAMTSLSIMAMLAVGHQPGDPTPAGETLRKAVAYILAPGRQETNTLNQGYYANDGSMMYGHGIVTLMLSELIGMGVDAKQDASIREHCQKAIDLIVRAQKVKKNGAQYVGGWRYSPVSPDADLSVSVWQVMALRAAKNAGLAVPKETIDDAVAYLKRSYTSARDKDGKVLNLLTGFSYVPGGGPSYSSATAGLLALQVCGDYTSSELQGTENWLRANKLKNAGVGYFYYGTYYFAQGMYQRGGKTADEARSLVEQLVLAEQKPDGRWQGGGAEASPVYATSMAVLSLSVRHHFMPIYQR